MKISKRLKIFIIFFMVLVLNVLLSIPIINISSNGVGTQSTNWGTVFRYSRFIINILGGGCVIYVLEPIGVKRTIKCSADFINEHISVIFIISLFIYLGLYEIYYAYCKYAFISPDSAGYLREAQEILAGNGFYYDKLAGYNNWFSSWPIGYPFLIAAVSFLIGENVYFSSKILSIIFIAIGLTVLYRKFKKEAWYYSFIYMNIGFLSVYCYTWSENAFVLVLLIWVMVLAYITEKEPCEKKWYIMLSVSMILAFLMRYIGIFTLFFTASVWIFLVCRHKKSKFQIKGIFMAELCGTGFVGVYFLINKFQSGTFSGVNRKEWWDDYNELTTNMYNSFLYEIVNGLRIDENNVIENIGDGTKAILLVIFLVWIIYVIYYLLKRGLDWRVLCILAGISYDFLFIFIRYYSSMDPFGYRFLVPGSMLIMLGIIGYLREKYPVDLKTMAFVGCSVLVCISIEMIQNIKTYNRETTFYHMYKNMLLEELEDIPPKAVILNYDGDYASSAFRPDLMFGDRIMPTDKLDDILSRYDSSSSIWISESAIDELCDSEMMSQELITYIDTLKNEKDGKQMQYVCIYSR